MRIIYVVLLICLSVVVKAQKYISERSLITFFSKAAVEDIAARNEKSMAMFDAATNEITFSVPIADFQFEKTLMKQHFNEKYMESGKYPKATFQGTISAFTTSAEGMQMTQAKGKLTIHGISRDVDIAGTIEMKDNRIQLAAKFIVRLADHKIKIPQLLWKNIAESVEVTIDFTLKPQE